MMVENRLIPSGAQTYSKSPSRWPMNAPRYLDYGDGPYVWDMDGNRYVDYAAALGPVILGYRHPKVDEAIRKQLDKGISFSLPTTLEAKLAEMICDIVPSAEMVRFCKNGADATNAAVKLTRRVTGSRYIAVEDGAYHGHDDWFQAQWASRNGIPAGHEDDLVVFKHPKDLKAWRKGEYAALIVEPYRSDGRVRSDDWWASFLQHVCESEQILIFDEIITFGRLHNLTVQASHGIIPDLTCLGKALANGMPLAAVCGKQEIMELLDEGVFFSTTFAGETLSLAAAIATLKELPSAIDHIWDYGSSLKERMTELTSDICDVQGWPARFVTSNWRDAETERIFKETMIANGILWNGYCNIMQAHDDETLVATIRATEKAVEACTNR